MSEFTASNGVVVYPQAGGGIYIRDDCRADGNHTQALREFFQKDAAVQDAVLSTAVPTTRTVRAFFVLHATQTLGWSWDEAKSAFDEWHSELIAAVAS